MEETRNLTSAQEIIEEEPYKSGSIQYIDSREVAAMVGKEHSKLLRDIKVYSKQLTEAKIGFSDFFIESSYRTDEQSRSYPCYMVTKKGCEFIAHKLTGIKGTKFTATYINRFHEMEGVLASGMGQGITAEQADRLIGVMENLAARVETLEGRPAQEFCGEPIDFRHDMLNERMRTLGCLVDELAMNTKKTNEQVLRAIYLTIENRKGISLNAYKAVYISESGEKGASMMKALVSYDQLYSLAVEMCRETLDACKMFGYGK